MLRNRGQWAYPTLTLGVALWGLVSWVGYSAFTIDQDRSGTWGCEMAYMWPSYNSIDWNGSNTSKYSLYLYREGRGVDQQEPTGYPVIFIPGNAGSYQQARSIGGAAASLFYARGTSNHWQRPIDLFTVDFNEDLSAFHAPSLYLQAQYVAAAIPRALAEYDYLPEGERPTTVTLLGHSMGGVVARLAETMTARGVIDSILTMSTPHTLPPAALEQEMEQLYNEINALHYDERSILISICGGTSDTLVISDACALPNTLVGPESGFAVFSTGIPGVWTPIEHQAMVWCDQVRKRMARALLDMASSGSRQGQMASLKKWLLEPSKLKPHPALALDVTNIAVSSTRMSLVVTIPDAVDSTLTDAPIEVRHCRGEDDCVGDNYHLSVIPWMADSQVPFPEKGKGTRPTDAAFAVDVAELKPGHGWLEVKHPHGSIVTSAGPFAKKNADNLDFGTIPTIMFRPQPAGSLFGSTFESRFYPLANGSVTLHSHVGGSPFLTPNTPSNGISVDILQQPGCPVQAMSLSLDLSATLAKAMLRLRTAIPAWGIGWVAVLQVLQFRGLSVKGRLPSGTETLERYGHQLAWIGSVLMMALLALQALVQRAGYPTQHFLLGHTDLLFLPIHVMAALWCLGTVMVVSIVMQAALRLGVGIHNIATRKREKVENVSTAWTMGSRFALGALLLWAVSTLFPFRLGLVILFIVHFALNVDAAAEDNVGVWRLNCPSPNSQQQSCSPFWESSLLLMAFTLPLCLPSVVVWGKNIWRHGEHAFPSDNAMLPIFPTLFMVLLFSLDRTLPRRKSALRIAQLSAAVVALVAFVLGPYRPWVLLPAVNFAFLVWTSLMLFKAT